MLSCWAREIGHSDVERNRWCKAGWLHDALRGAPDSLLNGLVPELDWPAQMRHGPAVANRAAEIGERDEEVLEAVRWHTVGSADWRDIGKALYCADFLEPGRTFLNRKRAALAEHFPLSPSEVLREVVELRLARAYERSVRPNPMTLAFQASLK